VAARRGGVGGSYCCIIVRGASLVAHRELNNSRRVRVVFDLLAEELAGR